MAEGLLTTLHGDRFEAFSAGVSPVPLSPMASRVMAEIGIDLSKQSAKGMETFVGIRFDCIAMVCGEPKDTCPFLPEPPADFRCGGCGSCCTFHPFFPKGGRMLHARFANLADIPEREEHLDLFRKVRDEIRDWIESTFGRTGVQ